MLGGIALGRVGLPSSYLFAALLTGLAAALWRPGALTVPDAGFRWGQAIAGVALGGYLQSSALREFAHDWLPVTVISAATLGLSLLAGIVLARTTEVDEPTAALGLIAGGASGIVGMSHELGADDRLVAFMQYLRVLIVVVTTPLVIAIAFPGAHAATPAGAGDGPILGIATAWPLTVLLGAVGAWLAARARLTAAGLLGPMILTGVVVLAFPGGEEFHVPPLLRESGFAIIGLQVGLRFTVATLRQMGRLLAPVGGVIAGLLTACFGLAVLLDRLTSASLLDCYLATTPGGLYAVLAVAAGSGADATFVVAVQSLRVVVMVLIAPLAVRVTLGVSGRRSRRRSRAARSRAR